MERAMHVFLAQMPRFTLASDAISWCHLRISAALCALHLAR